MFEVQKFNKQPQTIEAVKHDGTANLDLVRWCDGKLIPGTDGTWAIEFRHGFNSYFLYPDKWVVKDANGKFSVLSDEAFHKEYCEIPE